MPHALIFTAITEQIQRGGGAHRIATHLRNNGWDVEVMDFAAHLPLDGLKEFTRSRTTSDTKFFGFSTFFNYWTDSLSDLTKWMSETYPDIPRVLGGQSVALTPAENIDYWVDSFGEVAMLELAKTFVGNSSSSIKFDFYHLGKRKLIKAVHSYPAFPMKSYRNKMENRDFLQPYEWLGIELSRGCIFNCQFCNFPILGVKEDHTRDAEDFEEELKYNYENWGIRNYYLADETANDDIDKIIKFADVVENKIDFQPFFSAFMRADLMTAHPDSWEHIVRLGLGGHNYGIETFNHASGKMISKGMHPDKLKQGLLDIKKYFKDRMFYRGATSFIIGLPKETIASQQSTFDWLEENWKDQALITFPLSVDDLSGDKIHDYTNGSEISRNLDKYGIREMDTGKTRWGDHDYIYNWRDGNYHKDIFMWEHDTMNILQARELLDREQKKQAFKFKANNWQLSHLCFNAQSNIDLKTIETVSNIRAHKDLKLVDKFLKNYLESKLNWS
jgi:hypothetical protein